MRNYTGCSGFNYDHWIGNFYPEEVAKKRWLEFYAEKFDTVEINATFYNLPKEKTVENWYDRVPGNFRFTLKGSRFVTHQKKLNDPQEPVKKFYDLAAKLGGKLGCILWQLPGSQHKDVDKLENFCRALSSDFRNVIEFRHKSWWHDDVYKVLKKHDITFCIVSAPGGISDEAVKTNSRVYVRFHGVNNWYRYHYSDDELKQWADKIESLNPGQVYAYFNNDFEGHAPDNAATFARLIKK